MNFFIAKDYVKSLQAIGSANNQKVMFMPMELSNLVGTVGGIAELSKDILGDKQKKT